MAIKVISPTVQEPRPVVRGGQLDDSVDTDSTPPAMTANAVFKDDVFITA